MVIDIAETIAGECCKVYSVGRDQYVASFFLCVDDVAASKVIYEMMECSVEDVVLNLLCKIWVQAVKDLTDVGACVLEEGYRDVEIGGCKVRIGGMYEYAFALDGDNSAENLTGNVRDFLEEFQNTDRYKIMLCHRPDSFVFGDASDYWKIDLVISGHDHGGQVVIPFKGGLYGGDQGWFPPYVHGLYRTGRIRLFVTSGLSSEKQKLPRWNNRPEIAVLNVH